MAHVGSFRKAHVLPYVQMIRPAIHLNVFVSIGTHELTCFVITDISVVIKYVSKACSIYKTDSSIFLIEHANTIIDLQTV